MPEPFHEERFPTGISLKSRGGPQRRTEIVTLSSGHEQRNTRWADSRRRFEAGYGMRSLDDVDAVIAFFEQRRGRLYGFRWKDHADHKSCRPSKAPGMADQQSGTGDGAQLSFQLVKIYGTGTAAYQRVITKPVEASVVVGVDGDEQSEASDYTVDYATGSINFVTAPIAGAIITAGFEFDVPVRFDTDNFEINLDAFQAGQIPDISVVEIKL